MSFSFTETQDWFSGHIPVWTSLFKEVKSSAPRVLEIGSWEGRSAVFLMQNLCGESGELVSIDHVDLLQTQAGRDRLTRLTNNLVNTRRHYRIIPKFSVPALYGLLEEAVTETNPGFDWLYIDGSHEADDTFLDGELAWRLARKNAIVVFDDYRWPKEPEDSRHHPRKGIDAFLHLHSGEYDIISGSLEGQYQMILRKTSEMRIGFYVQSDASSLHASKVASALEYGMNVAITTNSAYAPGAVVVIESLVRTTPGRITIYVLDSGLTELDRSRLLEDTKSESNRITMKFIEQTDNMISSESGDTWAKIDIINFLPVERVLYLDADTLVRSDVTGLWTTDLEGKSIGATIDVGHPMGHDALPRAPYFNAGVLIMDLTKIRKNLVKLTEAANEGKNLRYKDQDVLNLYFRDDWKKIDLRWNAQGLGTYAESPSPEREKLQDLEPAKANPAIVHFTDPLHPSLPALLNPYVQPVTAKPWGYAGAPGHPLTEKWWTALERTSWKGWKASDEYKQGCQDGKAKAIQDTLKDMERILAGGSL